MLTKAEYEFVFQTLLQHKQTLETQLAQLQSQYSKKRHEELEEKVSCMQFLRKELVQLQIQKADKIWERISHFWDHALTLNYDERNGLQEMKQEIDSLSNQILALEEKISFIQNQIDTVKST